MVERMRSAVIISLTKTDNADRPGRLPLRQRLFAERELLPPGCLAMQ